jgi:hypothetical protein
LTFIWPWFLFDYFLVWKLMTLTCLMTEILID